ncbi:hypothetical protein [Thermodesulfovibrio thiophilus]|uniref:hypothetical protein n=1 Tax=Thermodesulfovibrio thiophilus TaxID=340095 RepID=UPI000415E91F|nr:hypothetical protein [Thermodesulfovibrio thiophilus]
MCDVINSEIEKTACDLICEAVVLLMTSGYDPDDARCVVEQFVNGAVDGLIEVCYGSK